MSRSSLSTFLQFPVVSPLSPVSSMLNARIHYRASPIRLSAAAAEAFSFKPSSLKKQSSKAGSSAASSSRAGLLDFHREKEKQLVERGRLLLKRRAGRRRKDEAMKKAMERAMEKEVRALEGWGGGGKRGNTILPPPTLQREKEKTVRKKLQLLEQQQQQLKERQDKERLKQRRQSRRGSFTSAQELNFMLEQSRRNKDGGVKGEPGAGEGGAGGVENGSGSLGTAKQNKAARRRASLSLKVKKPSLQKGTGKKKKTKKKKQQFGEGGEGEQGDDDDDDDDDDDYDDDSEEEDEEDQPRRRPSQLEKLAAQIARSLPSVNLAGPISAMESLGSEMEKAVAKLFGD